MSRRMKLYVFKTQDGIDEHNQSLQSALIPGLQAHFVYLLLDVSL